MEQVQGIQSTHTTAFAPATGVWVCAWGERGLAGHPYLSMGAYVLNLPGGVLEVLQEPSHLIRVGADSGACAYTIGEESGHDGSILARAQNLSRGRARTQERHPLLLDALHVRLRVLQGRDQHLTRAHRPRPPASQM